MCSRIKKHTAQSLGRYLGSKVKCAGGLQETSGKGLILTGISQYDSHGNASDIAHIYDAGYWYPWPTEKVYPILKPASLLSREEKALLTYTIFDHNNGQFEYSPNTEDSNLPDDYDENFNFFSDGRNLQDMLRYAEKLIEMGFGAIPNPESPTGYVDLFGYPCIVEK